MDAPVFPPSASYQAPLAAPFEFGVDTVSVKELLSAPQTRDLVLREAPILKMLPANLELQGHLSNFTLRVLASVFGAISPEQLAKIDRELRDLPSSARPAL